MALDAPALMMTLALGPSKRRSLQLALAEMRDELVVTKRKGMPPRYSLKGRTPKDPFGPIPDPPAKKGGRRGGFIETQSDTHLVDEDSHELDGAIWCCGCHLELGPLPVGTPKRFTARVSQMANHQVNCPAGPEPSAFWHPSSKRILGPSKGFSKEKPFSMALKVNIPVTPGTSWHPEMLYTLPDKAAVPPKVAGRLAVQFSGDQKDTAIAPKTGARRKPTKRPD